MANMQSTLVSNEANVPIIYNKVGLYGGRTRSITTSFTSQGSGSNGDTYVLARLNPEWRIQHIWVWNEQATSTNVDVGLVSDVSGTAISADATACYADGITFNASTSVDCRDVCMAGGTKGRTFDKYGQEVYLDAGHTTVNKLTEYFLCITAATALANSKKVAVNVQFTVD